MNSLQMPNTEFCVVKEKKLSDFLLCKVGHENFRPGLDRLRPLFQKFKRSFKNKKIVTIAGTNGKGEVSLCLASLLMQENSTIALWTSPHILSLRERFFSSHGLITYSQLETLFFDHQEKCRELSYYEFLFYCFCSWVEKLPNIDVIIFEVGLGGRYDAVNLFTPNLCGLTSISLDHQSILGNTIEKILDEKVGIARAHVPFVSALEQVSLRAQLSKTSQLMNFPFHDLFMEGMVNDCDDYRQRNRCLAKVLFRYVQEGLFSKKLTRKDLPTSFKGRFELMTLGNKRFIFIGAHNLDGLQKTQRALSVEKLGMMDYALVSFSQRPVDEIFNGLVVMLQWQELVKQIFISSFVHPKAAAAEVLKQEVERIGQIEKTEQDSNAEKKGFLKFVDDWKTPLSTELEATAHEQILVLGSYYFIGEVQKYLLSS